MITVKITFFATACMDITLVFPDQLFLNHPCIAYERPIYLMEEYLFFKVQSFHKQRLVLLKAAMRSYAGMLARKQYEVVYISSDRLNERGTFYELLGKKPIKNVYLAEFADEWLHIDLIKGAEKFGWHLHFFPSPGFICSNQELGVLFKNKKHFSMAQFYAHQRKSQDILMQGKSPLGGKYSFDAENRRKLPKGVIIPKTFTPKTNPLVQNAIDEVGREFHHAIGDGVPFLYPTNHDEAHQALQRFLDAKLALFGDYQDAIQMEDSFLFHSVLSSSLNCGLLTPHEVIHAAIHHAKRHSIPHNSLEGFLRQIMGWREFVRASYLFKGSFQRTFNFFQHTEKIPKCFWEGATGLLPIDATINKVLKTGYCHHIERLMVLGNFLLLTETAPNEIYKWFMSCFVDAYDWVMVPNVYGMSQYADGGEIVTKPYISSSNYLLKMSNYPKGEWTEIWDGLYWRFLKKHRPLFSSNKRTAISMKMYERNEKTILPKIKKSELWLTSYRSGSHYK